MLLVNCSGHKFQFLQDGVLLKCRNNDEQCFSVTRNLEIAQIQMLEFLAFLQYSDNIIY